MSTFFGALERAEQERVQRHRVALSQTASDWGLGSSAESRRGLEQLERLFDYVRFDLGLYAVVAIIFATAISFEPSAFKFHRGFLGLAVGFVCVAGMSAGIIASRCAHFTSRNELLASRIGPFQRRWLKGEHWVYVQHVCFGIALVAAVLSVLMGYGRWLAIASCGP
jgi:hypothetical protein